MRWLEIAVEANPDSAEDIRAVMARWAHSAVAVEERLDELSAEKICRLTAYLADGDELPVTKYELLNALWHLGQLGVEGASNPSERWTDESEWHTKWKAFFKPLLVGRILLAPSWDDSVRGTDLVVRIDPGMAFGTGLHITTRQTLLALQDRLRPGDNVLDLGTGSGVLAIAAARLGAGIVTALDKDPRAVDAARANVAFNQVEGVVNVDQSSFDAEESHGRLRRRFDLLMANIVASVHCELASAMIGSLTPAGTLILGGIIRGREADVVSAFERHSVEVVDRSDDGEWICMTLRNGSSSAN